LNLNVSDELLTVLGRLGKPFKKTDKGLVPLDEHWERGVVFMGKVYWIPKERWPELITHMQEREAILKQLNIIITRNQLGIKDSEEKLAELQKALIQKTNEIKAFLENKPTDVQPNPAQTPADDPQSQPQSPSA